MVEASFDNFTLSSDYSLDTSKYNLLGIQEHLHSHDINSIYKSQEIRAIPINDLGRDMKDPSSKFMINEPFSYSSEKNKHGIIETSNPLIQELKNELSSKMIITLTCMCRS